MTERNNFDLLYEDFTLGSNNSMGVGDTGMNLKPEKKQITFFDLLDQANKMREEESTAPPITPYPIQYNVTEDLADAYTRLADAASKFRQATKNPVVSDNPKALKTTVKMYKKIKKAQAIIKSFTTDLDNLTV